MSRTYLKCLKVWILMEWMTISLRQREEKCEKFLAFQILIALVIELLSGTFSGLRDGFKTGRRRVYPAH